MDFCKVISPYPFRMREIRTRKTPNKDTNQAMLGITVTNPSVERIKMQSFSNIMDNDFKLPPTHKLAVHIQFEFLGEVDNGQWRTREGFSGIERHQSFGMFAPSTVTY